MSEQTHQYNRPVVWATIIAALIGAGATLYIYFDSKEVKADVTKNSSIENKEKETTSLTIKEVVVTPVDFDIPSSFYIEIENGHLQEAKDATVIIDFGESKIEKCSVKPNVLSNLSIDGDEFIFKVKIHQLLKDESFYINCLASAPIFKKVLISGGNALNSTELTYESYKEQRSNKSGSGWYIFFSILAGIFCLFIFIVIITKLAEWLGMDK